MARETVHRCDVCRKTTERIVAKLLYVPRLNGPFQHSLYTHHCDVGECCGDKVLKLLQFRPRMSAKEYQEKRKAGKH